MSRLDYFERGRELYKGKRYKEAAEHFLLSIVKEYYNVSLAWLADCYEYGLGVEKNRLMAKDLYQVSYNNIGYSKRNTKFCAWVCPIRVSRRSASMNSLTALSEATTKTSMTRCSNSAARRCATLTTIFGKKRTGCIWRCRRVSKNGEEIKFNLSSI